jgi:hypothetical protein
MMNRIARLGLLALAVPVIAAPAVVVAAVPVSYEESVAREEESLILRTPIGGIENSRWFDYRINVNESQKELASDLRHATDLEDRRDAFEEYAVELRHERRGYV